MKSTFTFLVLWLMSITLTNVYAENTLGLAIGKNGKYKIAPAAAPSFINGATQSFTVCQDASAVSLATYLSINDLDVGQTLTWSIVQVSTKGTLSGFPAAIATNGGTVSPNGVTYTPSTGLSGTDKFVISASDGSATVQTTINVTINPAPTVAAITGTSQICLSGTRTSQLACATTGGVWSSSATAVATITTGGLCTGRSAGTAIISYTVTNTTTGCTAASKDTITVYANTNTVTITPNTNAICAGSTLQLTGSPTGGTWTSSNTTNATVDANGLVTGVTGGGFATITYTVNAGPCGTSQATRNLTVNTSPNINPITFTTSSICVGSTTTFTGTNLGGNFTNTWSSSNTAIATVSTTGVVTGVAAGSAVISYTSINRNTNCSKTVTQAITVSDLPSAGSISGVSSVCVGTTTKLIASVTGGNWTSGNSALATIDPSTGVVTPLVGGVVATFSYIVTNGGCSNTATYNLSINNAPSIAAITGNNTLCIGTTTTLSNTTTGGTWSSGNTAVATVTSNTGVVTGIASGVDTIYYTVSNGTCTSSAAFPLTVSAGLSVSAITGGTNVCANNSLTLSSATTGGTWSLTNSTLGTINSTGVFTGLSAGIDTIIYTVSSGTGCSGFASLAVTINANPALDAIAGKNTLCTNDTTTLTNSTSGGFWISSDNSIATISSSGLLSGISAGTTTITYTVIGSGSCTNSVTKIITIISSPNVAAIVGSNTTCVGSTVQYTNTTIGGVWTSSSASVASISSGGLASGLSTGSSTIGYAVTRGGCTTTATLALAVNASLVLQPITGNTTACIGTNETLSNGASGGSWFSSNTAVATINQTTGVLTPVSAGSSVVTYVVNTGTCSGSVNQAITVAAKPTVAAIAVSGIGGGNICVGSTATFSNTTAGGTWSSSNNNIAKVATNGVVTGTGSGTATISYTVTSGGCSAVATRNISVTQFTGGIAAINGTSPVCVGATTTFTNATSGGTWSSSDTKVATVTTGGVVTGVGAGSASIVYSITQGFCAQSQTKTIVVNAIPTVAAIAGGGSICSNSVVLLTNATGSGTWSSSNNSVATVSNLGLVTAKSAGTDTIYYSVTNTTTGCSNTVNTILKVNATSSSTTNASLCTGSGYVFNGKTYTTAGTYTTTLVNSAGCDSIATLILSVKGASSSTTTASVCSGSSYSFNGKTYTTAGTYTATLVNSAGCDSIATLVLSVKAASSSTTTASICSGSSYSFNGKTYTTAGTYTATLVNSVGCDSIATLVLSVKPTSSSTTTASVCSGSSYSFNGKTYTTAGTYTATLVNSIGCDSIATLVLSVKPTSTSTTTASICSGSSYSFNGKTYTTAGTYTATLLNSVGCDSIATLVLSVKSATSSITTASVCAGSSYSFNGKTYTTAGTYTATLVNSAGCDSIATLVLSVKPTSSSTTTASICSGSSYSFNGKTYTTAGTYTATLVNSVGCDSIATLVLSVKAISSSTSTASICSGRSYSFNGKTYTTAGTYTATLVNSVGCDSIATLVLSVKATSSSTTTASICAGSSYSFNGKTYTTAGTYTATLVNSVGCDSIATLVLSVKSTSTSTTTASICAGSSYSFNGKTYTTAGTYTATLVNSVGCDSIATLVLSVKSTSTSTTTASICSGSSYSFNGKTYTTAGTYTATLVNSVGCDSIATLVLSVKSATSSTTTASICSGSSYSFNGKTYTTAGTYTATLVNSVGCDSIATLVLSVKSTSTSTTTASICAGSSYSFNGKTYTTAGTYTATLVNSVGCDSIATLVLSVKSTSSSTTTASICSGSSYSFNGKTYITAGTYTATLVNSVGCDSIATLVLSVKSTSTSTTTASICSGSSYSFNGKTYTIAGTYTATLVNSVGCDSIATLVLSVKSTSSSTTTASICSGSSYSFNGKTYNTAGTYTSTLVNSAGCDSIATLVLSVKSTSTSTTTASICSGSSYSFNGKTYTIAGTYTATLVNSVGCDSIATLVLSVKSTSTSTTTASICSGSSYSFNGKTYTTAGTYTATLVNSAGCDSIATLVLSVKSTSTSTTTASICTGSSYSFNGKTYTTAGTYTATLVNSVGCDSIATLVLSVTSSASPSVSITASATSISAGTSVTFTAVPTNGGTTPSYQWTKNGMNISGANSNTYTSSTLSNKDTIRCIITSSLTCVTTPNATSNSIIISVTTQFVFSGNVHHPLGTIIPGVTVSLTGGSTTSKTVDAAGNYSFPISPDSNYTVRASKNNDVIKTNGVSVLDVIQIQAYILKKLTFSSPYKVLAADVNNTGSVTTLDILLLKRLILNTDTSFSGRLWGFSDSAYQFADNTNPFPNKDSISVSKATTNKVGQSLIGYKLGDVTWDWSASTLGAFKQNKPVEFYHNNVSIAKAQQEVRIPVKVRNFNQLLGMQFTLNFNPQQLKLKAIENNLLDVEYGTKYSKDGKLAFLWNDVQSKANTLADGTVLMELVFEKVGDIQTDNIAITSDLTPIEAYDADFKLHTIVKTEGKLITSNEDAIYAESWEVAPVPTAGPVNIKLSLKSDKVLRFELVDAAGKLVFSQKVDARKGTNQFASNLNAANKLPTGVYYLKAVGLDDANSIKRIIVK